MVKTQFCKCSGNLPRQCLIGRRSPRAPKVDALTRAKQKALTGLYNLLIKNGVGVTGDDAATTVLREQNIKGVKHGQIVSWLRTLADKLVLCATKIKVRCKQSEQRVYRLNELQVDSFQRWREYVTTFLGIPMMPEAQPAV